MMIKIERIISSRVYTDPRVNMLGERVERVWEDSLLNPRHTYRWSQVPKYTQGDTTMKEKAKNVKTDKKYWTDPMSFPVYTPKRGR
jgi:hypothetical protein